jgi:hypothetical protein
VNAFSKLGAEYLVCTSVKIVAVKKERQSSTNSNPGPLVTQPSASEDGEQPAPNGEPRTSKRRISTTEFEGDSKRRLSKRVRAHEESAVETGNARSEEFINAINNLLAPLDLKFGDYAGMEFFVRSGSETSDPALDVWKNFLWEWSTERALPFETNFKHKYVSSLHLY